MSNSITAQILSDIGNYTPAPARDICYFCKKTIPHDEPLFFTRFTNYVGAGFSLIAERGQEWACSNCLYNGDAIRRRTSRRFYKPIPCVTCGRLVSFPADSTVRKYPLCSAECRYKHFNKLASKRRKTQIRCAVCEEFFIPTRKDAATCSSKCRQRAYRNRKQPV